MEKAITECSLKLLAFETPCDVILSCQDRKLEAHKVILSIASPVIRDLLAHAPTETAVLIFPDVNSKTMALMLDYIYNGFTNVLAEEIQDFFNLTKLLEIYLDREHMENVHTELTNGKLYLKENQTASPSMDEQCKLPEFKRPESKGNTARTSQEPVEGNLKFSVEGNMYTFQDHDGFTEAVNYSKHIPQTTFSFNINKHIRKIPNLMPLSVIHHKHKRRKELYNQAFPSPWCPRNVPLLADPRDTKCASTINAESVQEAVVQRVTTDGFSEGNDSNNNFAFLKPASLLQKLPPPLPNSIPLALAPPMSMLRSEIHQPPLHPPSYEVISPTVPLLNEKDDGVNCRINPLDAENVPSTSQNQGRKNADEENIQNNNKQKPFKCQDCGKTFSQLRNFKYHRSIHEGTKEFAARCPECGKLFNDRGYLSSHLKIHRDRKEYACPHCPKRFNQRVAYNMHLRVHTGLKPHECPTCGKGFSRKMLLKQHQRVHTGERPYSCPECGKTFADRSNMSLHQRLHTGVKPYTCSLCPKSFTKKHHLKTHMNFHTGLKPYSCQKCGFTFSQSSNMRTHYKKCILKPNHQITAESFPQNP